MTAPQYNVVLVNQAGGERKPLVRAQLLSATWELNGWGEMRWVQDVLDPQLATEPVLWDVDAISPPREVQLWRNGRLIWWGLPNGVPSCDGSRVTFTAYGLLWYFARRYFGPVYSNTIQSLLTNGDFELDPLMNGTGIGGWAATGPTSTAATLRRKFGNRACRLTTTAAGGDEQYIVQAAQLPSPARTRPLLVTASAWVFPEVITLPAWEDRGLTLQAADGTQAWAPVNADVPKTEWTRLEVEMLVPAATSNQQLLVACSAPAEGSIVWDRVRCDYQQRTGAVEGQDWSNDYLRRVFNLGAGNSHGGSTGPGGSIGDQNQWWGSRHLKSNLGMTFLESGVAGGSLRADVYWDHEDHGQVYEAMLEVVRRNLLDFEIVWNATGTVRQLASYPPRKGALRPGMVVELGRDLTALGYSVDGRRTANDVRVIGRNKGNTKEVGQAGGPRPYTLGHLQLEAVVSAPDEVEGHGLAETALWEERRRRGPIKTPSFTVPAQRYLDPNQPGGALAVGDSVPVRVRSGWLQDVSTRRVVSMTLQGPTDELELTVNEA